MDVGVLMVRPQPSLMHLGTPMVKFHHELRLLASLVVKSYY